MGRRVEELAPKQASGKDLVASLIDAQRKPPFKHRSSTSNAIKGIIAKFMANIQRAAYAYDRLANIIA
jgi:hypothetical protein